MRRIGGALAGVDVPLERSAEEIAVPAVAVCDSKTEVDTQGLAGRMVELRVGTAHEESGPQERCRAFSS